VEERTSYGCWFSPPLLPPGEQSPYHLSDSCSTIAVFVHKTVARMACLDACIALLLFLFIVVVSIHASFEHRNV